MMFENVETHAHARAELCQRKGDSEHDVAVAWALHMLDNALYLEHQLLNPEWSHGKPSIELWAKGDGSREGGYISSFGECVLKQG
jgi:hypothetical protein